MRMTNFRFLSGFFVAVLTALIFFITYFSGIPHWFMVAALTLSCGLGLGLFLRRLGPAARDLRGADQENPAGAVSAIDFSSDLLDAAVNEMREGLLVIDGEMRVLASNRAARSLLSPVDDSINMRRLTELTRNPAHAVIVE